jgi:hypothetical protein
MLHVHPCSSVVGLDWRLYDVSQRTRDLGMRGAIDAMRADVSKSPSPTVGER